MGDVMPIETRYKGFRFRSRLEARWAVFFDTLGVLWEYESEGFELSTGERYLPDFWMPDNECWIEVKGQPMTEAERRKVGLLAAEARKWVDVLTGSPWPGAFTVRAFHTALPTAEDTEAWELLCSLKSLWPARNFLRGYAECHYYLGRWVTPAILERAPYMSLWPNWGREKEQTVEWHEFDRTLGICPKCGRLMFGYPATEGVIEFEWYRERLEDGQLIAYIGEDRSTMPEHFLACDVCIKDWPDGVPADDIEGSKDHPRLLAAFKAARAARFEHGEKP